MFQDHAKVCNVVFQDHAKVGDVVFQDHAKVGDVVFQDHAKVGNVICALCIVHRISSFESRILQSSNHINGFNFQSWNLNRFVMQVDTSSSCFCNYLLMHILVLSL